MDFEGTYPPGFHNAQSAVSSALSIAQVRQLSGSEFVLVAIAGELRRQWDRPLC